MTTLEAAGQLLAADVDNRTLSYRILPFGEQGRTSLGLVTASAGTIDLPADPSAVTLNLEHDYTRPVGRATSVTETDAGIDATFAVARTSAGNDLLAEAADGLRTGASVEISGPVIRDGRLLGGRLDAVASCVRPAFPSAQLTASDTGDDPETPTEAPAEDTTEEEEEEVMPETQTPEAEAETQAETTTAPAQLTAGQRPAGTPAQPRRPVIESIADLGRLLARFHNTGDRDVLDVLRASENAAAGQMFAALSDIKWDGTGGLSQTIRQPQWLGNVWNDRRFQRKIIPLLSHGDLTSLTLKGWKWTTKPAVSAWNGNKSAVPSGTIGADPVTGTAQRYAGAHDIAREFRDFGSEEFWTMYLQAMTDSYAEVTDLATADTIKAGATDVVPGTVPTNVPTALSYIVDGALSMIDDIAPTFALVAKDLWRDLVLTPTDHALEFLSAALGLESGTLASFAIQPYSGLDDGTVLVGSRLAATVYELPGSPIRVEAENLANGGIDDGFFGYHGTLINEATGLALVAPSAG